LLGLFVLEAPIRRPDLDLLERQTNI